MNTSLLVSAEVPALPKRIITDWWRFSSGLWRLPEGDIQSAYCADIFPKVKVFMHAGRLSTNCGGHFSGPIHAAADCYPLISADQYRGPERRRYFYEGCDAAYQDEVFKLGPKVVFEASDPSVDEWRRMFRVLYADGGMFAHGVTYLESSTNGSRPNPRTNAPRISRNWPNAVRGTMPRTQAEMQHLLDGDEAAAVLSAVQQLDFTL